MHLPVPIRCKSTTCTYIYLTLLLHKIIVRLGPHRRKQLFYNVVPSPIPSTPILPPPPAGPGIGFNCIFFLRSTDQQLIFLDCSIFLTTAGRPLFCSIVVPAHDYRVLGAFCSGSQGGTNPIPVEGHLCRPRLDAHSITNLMPRRTDGLKVMLSEEEQFVRELIAAGHVSDARKDAARLLQAAISATVAAAAVRSV